MYGILMLVIGTIVFGAAIGIAVILIGGSFLVCKYFAKKYELLD